ncbi:glucosaminidase domain-containing protein [Shewanella sp. D64]|uniref:glucosaminidase domain-containing protein n=1 Tax=unclassified Shewanella TaxID=196818 RepID=UPI0022BA4D9D|nr:MULTISPECIES: glucosaminidase domain-containing protein [unclassified Shewanella]MEC4727406.1 glucosaminidase domain-containing protein [Shewanella sp. D64]MEC4739561.1 glucosaminidase domain-containing protein [Shewanella sp. E94]WBJ96056.1 glucosaminidase domain-containing protein [Shewanella sp. MTB7]
MTSYRPLNALLFIGIFTVTNATAGTSDSYSLTLMPENIKQPYVEVKDEITLTGAAQLTKEFAQSGYKLDLVRQNFNVPELYVMNLPDDLNNQTVENKIDNFVRLLLPNVLAVNQQILKVRATLKQMVERPSASLTSKDQVWLQALANDYGLKDSAKGGLSKGGDNPGVNIQQLLLHIDVIPTGMVLAQGIDESGWGTSHFAVQGNALYGEHLPQGGGKYLTTPGGHVKVAAFDSLYQGTAAYIYNLNSSRAYHELWQLREELRAKGKPVTGYELVAALANYSVRGQAYVNNLRSLIEHHHLDNYDKVELDPSLGRKRIKFN